jgi:tight adherence protein C
MLVVLLSVACIALAVFVGSLALLSPRPNATAALMQRIATSGAAINLDLDQSTFWDRLVNPLSRAFVRSIGGLLPQRMERHFVERITSSGVSITPRAYSTLLIMLPIGLGLTSLTLLVARGTSPFPGGFALALVASSFGAMAPIIWLDGKIKRRQAAIERALPDAFDLIVVSAEAGLGLEGAMARVSEASDGPLSDELRHALADMSLGVGRRAALLSMVDRIRLDSMRALVAAVLQADQTGMGIGQVLRAQSEHLRNLRRQRAEEVAMKAPIKMLFPLLFFIFPSLFIVVLGPAMITLMQTLGGH